MDEQEIKARKLIDESRLVGRRKPVWPWLLLILAVLLVAWYIWARANNKVGNDDQAEQQAQQQAKEAVNGNKSIMSDFNGVYGVTDIEDLNHREMEVNNLTVKRVISDRVFTVTNDPAGPLELYVVLAPSADQGSAENKVVVKAGQKVNLKGYIELASNLKGDEAEKWGLNDQQYQEMKGKIIYAVVSKVEQTTVE